MNFEIQKILNWNKVHACMMLIACLISMYASDTFILSVVSLTSFGIYVYMFRSELSKYSLFAGYPNLITLLRIVLLVFICIFWRQLGTLVVFSMFLSNILLDWLDGFVARKLGLTSDFGLYLDMETDAFLVSVISLIIWMSNDFHWVILFSGFLRYPYAVLLLFINKGNKKEPKRFYASFVTGFFYVSLLMAFLSRSTFAEYTLYISSILIIISFSRSLYFQVSSI
ncbi:MAG: phosphatidylglycerophosphate synthase [Salibacteraceae bacterium]|jgi:phosphatidylglycerophosphate synthase